MHYFVHGVDHENVGEQLEGFAEIHWAYMDAHAGRLVARGPTLSAPTRLGWGVGPVAAVALCRFKSCLAHRVVTGFPGLRYLE